MPALTIHEFEYLFNPESTNIWARYRIKQKIRNAYIVLDHVLNSERVDEFIDDLIPIAKLLIQLVSILPDEISIHILQDLSENNQKQSLYSPDSIE